MGLKGMEIGVIQFDLLHMNGGAMLMLPRVDHMVRARNRREKGCGIRSSV